MGPTAKEMLRYMHDEDPSEDGGIAYLIQNKIIRAISKVFL